MRTSETSGTRNEGLATCGHPSRNMYALGCRCDACRAAANEYSRQLRRRHKNGEIVWVDSGLLRRRVDRLKSMGYSLHEMERVSGISEATIRWACKSNKCALETYRAVCAISGRSVLRHQVLSGRRTVSLLRRWTRAGLSASEIGRVTGVSKTTICALLRGERDNVTAQTEARIASNIDELEARCPRNPGGRVEYVDWDEPDRDRIAELHRSGLPNAVIAERMGCTVQYVRSVTREMVA